MSLAGYICCSCLVASLRSLCCKRNRGGTELPGLQQAVEVAGHRTRGDQHADSPLREDEVGDDISPFLLVIELPRDFELALIRAWEPGELQALFPSFLQQYTCHWGVRTAHPTWTPEALLCRAYRAGVAARLFLLGDIPGAESSPPLPWSDRVFVVLRSRVPPGSWITFVHSDYIDSLTCGGRLDPLAVHHGFPSTVEGEVYLRGAHFERWPLRLDSEVH